MTTDAGQRRILAQQTTALEAGGGEVAARAATRRAGARLLDVRLRRVHRRTRSASLAYHATIEDGAGAILDQPLVVHLDLDELPASALVVETPVGPTAVWTYPNDPFLPGLAAAADVRRVGDLLARVGVTASGVELRLRAYRPTRRAVLEVVTGRGSDRTSRVYLKVLAGDRVGPLADVHRQLIGHGLPAPPIVAVSSGQGILVMRSLPGRTLRRAAIDGVPLPRAELLVDASRRLAMVDLEEARNPTRRADPTRYRDQLVAALPDRAHQIREVIAAATQREGPLTTVHGDLQPRQVLVGEARTDGSVPLTGLLDLDGAGPGHLASDAGSLIAYLRATSDRSPTAGPRVARLADELTEGYLDLVEVRALNRGRAATWLGLATAALRHPGPDARRLAAARIDRAQAVLLTA